eukprot:SAG11_NODE_9628_length_892_cov_90.782390_1_plen_78_part_10
MHQEGDVLAGSVSAACSALLSCAVAGLTDAQRMEEVDRCSAAKLSQKRDMISKEQRTTRMTRLEQEVDQLQVDYKALV